MNTKEAIVEASLKLLTAHLPLPATPSAGSLPITAGLSAYDFVLCSELSKYSYVFSYDSFPLNSPVSLDPSKYPVEEDDESPIRYYNLPPDLGNIFSVTPSDQVKYALALLTRSKKAVGTIDYTIIGGNVILVSSDQEDLYLIYTNLRPDPSVMTAPFKNGLRYLIASELVPLYKDSRGTRFAEQLMVKANTEFKEAQRLNDFSSGQRELAPTLDEVLTSGAVDGRLGRPTRTHGSTF